MKIDLEYFFQINGLRKLFSIVNQEDIEARIVGGSVRDYLIGTDIKDIDLAINIEPDKVIKLLEDKGITVIPTGIKFGTVTAHLDGNNFEITTLRNDIETDGRRAVVSYSKDWKEDAKRRDFTINALYLDKHGQIHDYFNGIEDLKNNVVRFIGSPKERIKEDHLRILRFFRFSSFFSYPVIEKEGLEASQELAKLLEKISGERIYTEIKKIIIGKHPEILRMMHENKILGNIFKEYDSNFRQIEILKQIEEEPNFLRRLFCLIGNISSSKDNLERLKLSNKEKKYFKDVSNNKLWNIDLDFERSLHSIIMQDLSLEEIKLKYLELNKLREKRIKNPFPLKAEDLIKRNTPIGKELGEKMKLLEYKWFQEFDMDKDKLFKYLDGN